MSLALVAVFPEAHLIKHVADSVKDLVTETNLECSSSGLMLPAMDSAHVALVSLVLTPECFSKFQCHRPVSLGLNLVSLAHVLSCAEPQDEVTFSMKQGAEDRLILDIKSSDGAKTTGFELKLMDISAEALGIPDREDDAVVTMQSKAFKQVCSSLSKFGDTICVAVAKEAISFKMEGDLGKLNQRLRCDDESIKINMYTNAVSCELALRYLINFTKATPLSERVKLHLKDDSPFVVNYSLSDNKGHLRFYLAPKRSGDEMHS